MRYFFAPCFLLLVAGFVWWNNSNSTTIYYFPFPESMVKQTPTALSNATLSTLIGLAGLYSVLNFRAWRRQASRKAHLGE